MLTDIKKKTMRILTVILAFLLLISFLGAKSSQAQSADPLRTKLELEVQKIISSGHLKPGYFSAGMLDMMMDGRVGEALQDYFHNSADTIYTLAIALPYLSSSLQSQVKSYLQQEYINYPLGSVKCDTCGLVQRNKQIGKSLAGRSAACTAICRNCWENESMEFLEFQPLQFLCRLEICPSYG